MAMNPEEYLRAVGKEKAFGGADLAVSAVAKIVEGDIVSQQILESVTIERLALDSLSRIPEMERLLKENADSEIKADALIMKAKEYPELPSSNIFLTKADFLSAAIVMAAVRPDLLEEMSVSNMFGNETLGGKGMDVLEMGRVANMVEAAKKNGRNIESADKLGQKVVSTMAQMLEK